MLYQPTQAGDYFNVIEEIGWVRDIHEIFMDDIKEIILFAGYENLRIQFIIHYTRYNDKKNKSSSE